MREPQIPTKVKFLEEWMGNPPGSYKMFWSNFANDLARRKIVEIVPSRPSLSAINDPVPEPERQRKMVRKPVRDKQIQKPPANK